MRRRWPASAPLGIRAIASRIRADLGLTVAQAGSFLSAYYVGPSLVALPAGALADRWGVRRLLVLVLGQLVIAAGLGPLAFGWLVQASGGYRGPWLGLAAGMALALILLGLVRERRRPVLP